MSNTVNGACIKLVGTNLQKSKKAIKLFSNAGFQVGIANVDTMETVEQPLGLIEQHNESNISIYLIEYSKPDDYIVNTIKKLKKSEPISPAIMLVIDRKPTIEELIFAGCNEAELLNISDSPEEIITRITSYTHNIAILKEKAKRKNLRFEINFPVVYSCDSYFRNATGINISREGVFLITLNPFKKGSVCRLIFSLPGLDKRFDIEAKVLYGIQLNENNNQPKTIEEVERTVHPGMAFHFHNVSEEDQNLISDYIINHIYK